MQYLADMGAEVVKIEPLKGAFERQWAGADRASVGGLSALFLCGNRNVRSLAIDLKHPSSSEVIFRLIERSHVVAENYRPGTLDRLGFGYEAVKKRKPDVIYASASGFGSSGPFADRPGQDLLLQAMSGLAVAGGRGDEPVPVGCAAVDQHGAALLALGIAGAYARWLRTGEGTRVETSLLGAAIDLQTESIVTYHASGIGRKGMTRSRQLATWFHPAPYGIYRITNGFVAISLNDVEALAAALGSPALAAFAGRNPYVERDELARLTAAEVGHRSFADLAAAFDARGIWYARVEDYDDLLANPQAGHNRSFMKVEVNGEEAILASHPNVYDGTVPGTPRFAMTPGADTRTVLAEAGFTPAEINSLIREHVVAAPEAAQ